MTRGDYERELSDRTAFARVHEAYIQQFTLVQCDGKRPGLPRHLLGNQQVAKSHAPLVHQLVERLRHLPLVGGHILHAPNGRTYWRERIDLRRLSVLDWRRGWSCNRRAEELGNPASHYQVPTTGKNQGAGISFYISADEFHAHGSSWGTRRDFDLASTDLLRALERRA